MLLNTFGFYRLSLFFPRPFYVVFCDTLNIVSICTIGWVFKYIVLWNNAMLSDNSCLPLVALFNHFNLKMHFE